MTGTTRVTPEVVPAAAARRLLLAGQGLLADPARRAGPAAVRALVESLGFVQVDSINVVTRAHHLTLGSRLDGYRPVHLERPLERSRELFENWTHDAAVIPTRWFAHWRWVFARARQRIRRNAWWRARLGGDPDVVLAEVLERVRREGPLSSRDFARGDAPAAEDGWWGWKPGKAALEHLWRVGELSVVRRVNFEKLYDLTERVLPEAHARPTPPPEAHRAWAMDTAIERLGVATPTELAAFWRVVSIEDARRWCAQAERRGELVEVRVEAVDGSAPRRAYARPGWSRRARALPEAPARTRLLSPFDPVVRDRARALRLFGFDYRFEAFTPEAQRKYGYYVLPVLEGESMVARADAKFVREEGRLELRRVWWERGVSATAARRAGLEAALERLAEQVGACQVALPPRRRAGAQRGATKAKRRAGPPKDR